MEPIDEKRILAAKPILTDAERARLKELDIQIAGKPPVELTPALEQLAKDLAAAALAVPPSYVTTDMPEVTTTYKIMLDALGISYKTEPNVHATRFYPANPKDFTRMVTLRDALDNLYLAAFKHGSKMGRVMERNTQKHEGK